MYIAKGDCEEPILFEPRIVPYLPPPGWFSPSAMSGDQRTVIKGNPSQYVKLNVGGCLYYTTIGTLTKAADTMLQAMFSGRMEVLTDPEGWILIDRCGKHFGTVLNYLRDGNVGLPTNSQELEEILAEAKFYCIAGLIQQCEKALENRNAVLSPVCQVPFITSEDERKQFIANAAKPVVELLINRHNNKYSYTNTSDENLLKNLEMFDRLALRFNGRIHFIKDAIGPTEICCWRFYGNGKKFAEVCCTSIVYATDRKHTKVEFPEARIYEETLNSFLYENRPGPDQELMRATSVGGVFGVGGVGVTSCTSDEEEDRRNHHRSSNMTKRKMKKSVRFADKYEVLNKQEITSKYQAAVLDSTAIFSAQRWNDLVRELDKIFRSSVQIRKASSFKTTVDFKFSETWDSFVAELDKIFPPSSKNDQSASGKKEEKKMKPMSKSFKWLVEHCDLKFVN